MLNLHSLPISLVFVACLAATNLAHAQAHQSKSSPCSVRSSTIDSRALPISVAKQRGFERSADLAIVNVTVSCQDEPRNHTVIANLDVTRGDLAGTREPIEMRLDRQNGYVSYYGTYRHEPGQVVRLHIAATPRKHSTHLTLDYQHRFNTG